ncbi:hypothetical protein M758_6G111800 [Ceratodon purpureus]|nr:hypothetical protein M758_6G111800 [Ceratodon purpureus]
MACLSLSRASTLWQAPIVLQSNPRPLLQHLVTAVDSSNLRPTYLYCRQRISIICASSWNRSGYRRKRSLVGLVRCQSHSYSSFSERREDGEEGGFIEEEENSRGHPSGRFPLYPIALLAQALAVFSSLRARLHLCRLKLEVLCEESEWEGIDGTVLKQGSLGMALLSTSMIARDRISPVLLTLRANPTFMSGLVAWAIAQFLKVFTKYWVERKWDWKMLVGSGGMPSSHSALCVGLTTAVALCHGVGDSLFPVCLGFTLIVMYDAAGVRRHAGRQAEVLNMIVEDLFQGHPVSEKKLKELLGHTPLQVGAGAILGMICGYICSRASMIY